MSIRVGWDVSHQEFTVEDHYYFSKLKALLQSEGVSLVILDDLRALEGFEVDVLVLNYPERRFSNSEISLIEEFARVGGRVLALGYYQNEDGVAEILNPLAERFNLEILNDYVVDEKNNVRGDPYFVVTTRISPLVEGVRRVLLPCSAPIKVKGDGITLIEGEATAMTKGNSRPVMAAMTEKGLGEFILLGTCVFWDNYSIEFYDNKKLALWLLTRDLTKELPIPEKFRIVRREQ